MRRAPKGSGPARRPGGAHKPGWGDAQQVLLVGSRSEMQKKKKKNPSSPRERGQPRQNGAFLDSSCRARWQGQDSGWPGPGGGAGPTGGRLRRAEARKPAGRWAGRCGRHQRTHPHTHTRALAAAAAVAAAAAAAVAAGGWRLEAAGALKARLLPTASAAQDSPSSGGGRGRGCGCSLRQWGARSREPAPGQPAARLQAQVKSIDARSQPPPFPCHAAEGGVDSAAHSSPGLQPVSGHLRFRTAKRSGLA